MDKKSNLSSVENALRILEIFSANESEKKLTQISHELNLAKSTTSRLLKTLQNKGYIKQNEKTKLYSLGNKILSLYNNLKSNMEILKEANPYLIELAKNTSESVLLAELENNQVIYTKQLQSAYPLQIFAHLGRINPIHCTSSGKLLLAYQNETFINEILNSDLKKYNSHTIIDKNILKNQLKNIKEKGYCYSENEFVEGIVSISAPIKDFNKNVIAAITLVGPIQRIDKTKANIYITKIVDSAKKISINLGYNYI